ncbi:MAG: helix-turn-helix domain-containing protein, partial [Actinobacteria bacterium]|nr:helix-turn-helix domain-containing protein [Actinomycetota bacterium]
MGEPVFGDELRRLREQHGLSLKKFAKLVHYDPGYLSKIENGLKPPTRALAQACDEALGTGTRLSSLVPPRAASTSSRSAQDGVRLAGNGSSPPIVDPMLDMLSGLGVGQVVDRETVAGLLERIISAEVGPGVVDEWHETAWEYGYRYLSDPREVLVADLAIDLARLELLLAHQSDSTVRRWLNDVGARLAALLAMACVDMGYVAEARWAWRLTRRRSDAGAQPETQLWVRGQEAIIGLYMARPPSVVLALAERGLAIRTASPSAGTTVLLAAKAQTLSRQGRGKEALDTLDTLRSVFERLPDTVTGCTDSIYDWPERRLCHTASFV